jgi:alginate O-acetyltransferase complex protein AlgJ
LRSGPLKPPSSARANAAALLACALAALGCAKKRTPGDFRREGIERITSELSRWGGSWDAWAERVSPFHDDVRAALESRPEEIQGIVGRDGFLFFRRSLEVLVAGDLREQEEGRNPYPAVVDFCKQLESRGIDMLFCPIPVKAAVMPEKLSARAPGPGGPWVDPWTRKLMLELAEAGVECVDLLPVFAAARAEEAERGPIYMPSDTHWSPWGLELAARTMAERIRAYDWFEGAAASPVEYGLKPVEARRRGDIVHMLPESEKLKYPPMKLRARQVVTPGGDFYEDDRSSPVVLLGDSYAGVFHLEDCRHAGLTAHLARELGVPIDLVLGQGMGPKVRAKLLRRGKKALSGKRLVIWTLSERDLYNYREPWDLMRIP